MTTTGAPHDRRSPSTTGSSHAAGGVYGLGVLGALVYYVETASGFGDGVVGVLKALLWPAFVVYEALHAMGA